jgi:hypothetical protein
MTSATGFPGRAVWKRAALGAPLLLVMSCRAADPPIPWNKAGIVRDVTADLRTFEHLNVDFAQVEVLAWRQQQSEFSPNRFPFPRSAPVGAPVTKIHGDGVLLWARQGMSDESGWALIQAYRAPYRDDQSWHRAIINRDLSNPSTTPLWPGETPDRTWPGIQRLDHPPTSREICEFADVDFLRARVITDWQTVAAAMQTATWIRVAGAKPECEIVW